MNTLVEFKIISVIIFCCHCRKMRTAVEEWKRDTRLNGLFGEVGALMESMFDGETGVRLMNATATFCQHQQHALEILRQRLVCGFIL